MAGEGAREPGESADGARQRSVAAGTTSDHGVASSASAAEWRLACSSLALGLFSVSTLIAFGYFNYTRIPWFDGWSHWIAYVRPHEPLEFIFSQHNEHRIPVSRILYFIDLAWFRADTRFLLVCTYLAQLGSAMLLYRLATNAAPLPAASRIYVLGVILAFAFSAGQWINFSWTFQVCFVVVFSSAIAAFAAFARSVHSRRRWLWVTAAIATALVATGSMANGLLVWPLLASISFMVSPSKRVTTVILAAGAATCLAYFHGYHAASGLSVAGLVERLPEILVFAAAYLGSAVDEPSVTIARAMGVDWQPYRVGAAAAIGFLGAALFVRLAAAASRAGRRTAVPRLALLHVAAFLGASAGLTAVGRVQFPLEDALTSRYVTPSLLFWATLIALTVPAAAVRRPPRVRLQIATLAAALLIGGAAQLSRMAYAADAERFLTEGEYAFINDVYTPAAWQRFYRDPGAIIPVVRFFRERRLASFSRTWTAWVGDPVASHFTIAPDQACVGAWESVTPLGGSFKSAVQGSGWGFDRRFNRPADLVVFADANGRIIGFASPTRRRPDLLARYPRVGDHRVGWVSFLPGSTPAAVTAYLQLGDEQSLCRLGAAQIPGTYETVPLDKAGPAVVGIAASTEGPWIRDVVPPDGTPLPFAGNTWSSHPVEAGRAVLRLGPFEAAAGASLAVPVLTGPQARTIRLSIVAAGRREVLTEALPPAGSSKWTLWRFEVPAGAPDMSVEVVAEDTSNRPGDWVVVGVPRLARP